MTIRRKGSAKKKPRVETYRTVRLRLPAHARLKKMLVRVSQDGWGSIGSTRTTVPTLTDLVEEGLDRLPEGGK